MRAMKIPPDIGDSRLSRTIQHDILAPVASQALIALYRPVLVAAKIQSGGFRLNEPEYIGVTVQNRGFKPSTDGDFCVEGSIISGASVSVPPLKPDGEHLVEIQTVPLKKGAHEQLVAKTRFTDAERKVTERRVRAYVPVVGRDESKVQVIIYADKIENVDIFNPQIYKSTGQN